MVLNLDHPPHERRLHHVTGKHATWKKKSKDTEASVKTDTENSPGRAYMT